MRSSGGGGGRWRMELVLKRERGRVGCRVVRWEMMDEE